MVLNEHQHFLEIRNHDKWQSSLRLLAKATETGNYRRCLFKDIRWKAWPLLCLVPARGCVSPAFSSQALLLSRSQGHCGSRVCFCYGHLFGLGSLFPTMGAVAGIVDSRGTVFMETMRDAAFRLTFHEVTLEKRRWKSFLKTQNNIHRITGSSAEPFRFRQVEAQLWPDDQQKGNKTVSLQRAHKVSRGHKKLSHSHHYPPSIPSDPASWGLSLATLNKQELYKT